MQFVNTATCCATTRLLQYWIVPKLTLCTPAEVARIEPECAVLDVPTAAAHRMDALVAKLSVRRRASHLKFPLLPELRALATRLTALVPRISRDTCHQIVTINRSY